MAAYKGLVYVKHGKVGSKSEGPVYLLQTKDAEYVLEYQKRNSWDPDYFLEFYGRSIVEVEGELQEENRIQVKSVREIGKRGAL